MATVDEMKKRIVTDHSTGALLLPDDCIDNVFSYFTFRQFRCVVAHLSRGFSDRVNGRRGTICFSPHLVSIAATPRMYTSLLGEDVALGDSDKMYTFLESTTHFDTEEMAVEEFIRVPNLRLFPRLQRFMGDWHESPSLSPSPPPLTLQEWRMYSAPFSLLSSYSALTTLEVLVDTVETKHLLTCPSSLTSLHLKNVHFDTPEEALCVFRHLSSLTVIYMENLTVGTSRTPTEISVASTTLATLLTPLLVHLVELKLPFSFFSPPLVQDSTLSRLPSRLPSLHRNSFPMQLIHRSGHTPVIGLPPSTAADYGGADFDGDTSIFATTTASDTQIEVKHRIPSTPLPPPPPSSSDVRLRCLRVTVSPPLKTPTPLCHFLRLVSPTLSTLHLAINGCVDALVTTTDLPLLRGLKRLTLEWDDDNISSSPFSFTIRHLQKATHTNLFSRLISRCPLRELELIDYPSSRFSHLHLSPLRGTLTHLTLHVAPLGTEDILYTRKDRTPTKDETDALTRLPVDVPLLFSFYYTGVSLDTIATILPLFPHLSRLSIDRYGQQSVLSPLLYTSILLSTLSRLPTRVGYISLEKQRVPESLRGADTRWHLRDVPLYKIPRCRCRQVNLSHRWACPIALD